MLIRLDHMAIDSRVLCVTSAKARVSDQYAVPLVVRVHRILQKGESSSELLVARKMA